MTNHNFTPFQRWLMLFIVEKNLELGEPVTAGDGSILQLGDVIQVIFNAPNDEQRKIKETLVMIDFKNGDVIHFLRFLAKRLNQSHKTVIL